MDTITKTHPVDRVPKPFPLVALGLQHVLVMYAGAVAVPLIIGAALKLPKDQIAFLINADLFACGIATLVQSVGIGNIGIRLPVIMGVAFTAVGPIIEIGSNPALGFSAVFGAVIVSGIFTLVMAPYVGRLVHLFPPVVTGTVLMVIGITLMRVAVNWSAGGSPTFSGPNGPVPNPAYGAPLNLLIALLVLTLVIVITKFASGFIRNVAILLSIGIGFLVTIIIGKVDFSGVANASWFAIVRPFMFGLPTFNIWAVLSMCVVMTIMMIEAIGTFLALGEITGRPVSQDDLTRGIRADGLATVIGGIMNTFTYTTYSQNVGLVQITRVNSRWVCAVSGVILIVLALIPKIAFVVASVPQYVLGGAAIVMFGMVISAGIRIVTQTDFVANDKNLYIVAISIGVGLIPLISDSYFNHLPHFFAPLLHSGILLATLSAVFLNMFFNGFGKDNASMTLPLKQQQPAEEIHL